tara:strand:- start:694 stop:1089 length:396 start_codon:yes stop_codon:yes gene_type:complete
MENCDSRDSVIRPNALEFEKAPSASIDYAVLEISDKVAVIPVNPIWSDVGSWDSLFKLHASDKYPNVTFGEVTAIDSKNNFVRASGVEVSTFGVEDLIIIANRNQVMILPRGQSENVKSILQERKNLNRLD